MVWDTSREVPRGADRKVAGVSHTPGPWRVSQFYGGLSVVADCEEPHMSIFDFAGAGSEGEPWREQTLANARLCAAAPELLAALEEMVKAMTLDDTSSTWNAAIEKSQRLIARLRPKEE